MHQTRYWEQVTVSFLKTEYLTLAAEYNKALTIGLMFSQFFE